MKIGGLLPLIALSATPGLADVAPPTGTITAEDFVATFAYACLGHFPDHAKSDASFAAMGAERTTTGSLNGVPVYRYIEPIHGTMMATASTTSLRVSDAHPNGVNVRTEVCSVQGDLADPQNLASALEGNSSLQTTAGNWSYDGISWSMNKPGTLGGQAVNVGAGPFYPSGASLEGNESCADFDYCSTWLTAHLSVSFETTVN